MAVIIFNPKEREIDESLKKVFKKFEKKLDLVVCFGGDGTILGAERIYPGVPKLGIRASSYCHLGYPKNELPEILEKIADEAIRPREVIKLNAVSTKGTIQALNDIQIHNRDPRSAVRLRYQIEGLPDQYKESMETIICDGIILATPFGSSGYFKSISGTVFMEGIGLAVNNPTVYKKSLVLTENMKVRIDVERGPAFLLADNNPTMIELESRDVVIVGRAKTTAKIY